MKRVLISGATGNVGNEVSKSLNKLDHQLDIIAGVREMETDREKMAEDKINLKKFDFTNIRSDLR